LALRCDPSAVVPALPGIVAVERQRDQDGLPTVFAVTAIRDSAACRPASFRVQVPVRPNGSSRWVDAQRFRVLWVDTQIVIHVESMRLELQRGGRVVLRSRIAPGAPETPTPLGRFYVTKRLIPKDPNGPWGPAALGTSAFSPVLKNWAEGGPIGIHGTNEPWVIGRAASHGCIRLPNTMMKRLFAQVPAGTPVLIRR
jgi:lipoprotein-anchoring transpeptidase ErfK/SrfK